MKMAVFALNIFLWSCIAFPYASPQNDPAPSAIVKKLTPPEYPTMALIAGISGDVIIRLSIRPDGSIESVRSTSGHPLLTHAVIENARQSRFECPGCGGITEIVLRYSFLPAKTKADRCCCSSGAAAPQPVPPSVEASASEVHITITGLPLCICPDACTVEEAVAQSHFRSAKCLYLWKCGRHRVVVY